MRARISDRLLGRAWPSQPSHEGQTRVDLLPPKRGRVHLGCGDVYLRGYLNVDLPPAEGVASGTSRPDVESDAMSVSCPAGTLAEIRLHHLFEHFERTEALALLLRWYRWLAPGGRLTIETPDFEGCIANFSERPVADQGVILRHIFGSQEAAWAQHRDGWSPNRFRYVLGQLGFTRISTSRTFSDTRRMLPNVIVKAHRPSDGGHARETQTESALLLLRQAMNGDGPSEEQLFVRWRSQFETLCAQDAG
jgi:hypothetical protein